MPALHGIRVKDQVELELFLCSHHTILDPKPSSVLFMETSLDHVVVCAHESRQKIVTIGVTNYQRGKTRDSPLADVLGLLEYPLLLSLSPVPAEQGKCPTTLSTSTSVACPRPP